jgi:uncharacterized protein (TIGR00661 family)
VSRKRVLVAPMDWGLGHATRCIPVIREMINLGHDVAIAGSGDSLNLLKGEFPFLNFFELAPYSPKYASSSRQVWKLARQLLKFHRTIRNEHHQTGILIKQLSIDLILSDNRYGCWSRSTISIFMCHQVTLLLPETVRWLAPVINHIHLSYIRNFKQCWIPDWEGKDNLACRLSKTKKLPAIYVGPLSRFGPGKEMEKTYDLTFVLSGPEPQRTLLEEIISAQVFPLKIEICIVRGISGTQKKRLGQHVTVFDFLNSDELAKTIRSSKLIVARSGYSTVMDLYHIGGNVVFVPTPGQPEQEHLARCLEGRKIAPYMAQHTFNVGTAIEISRGYAGFEGAENDLSMFKAALKNAMMLSN